MRPRRPWRPIAEGVSVFKTIVIKLFVCVLVLLGNAAPVLADGGALEALRSTIDEGIHILDDPELVGADGWAQKEEKLWRLSERLFDYPAMSRLVLGSYWDELTPRQREAFYVAFAGFLRRAYVPRLLERYSGQRIYFDSEQIVSPSRAVVGAYVFWMERKIPFNIHMLRRQEGWKIYDISTMGVSAVKNYRAQFRWLLLSGTLDQLIARLNTRANPAS
jgi:phospholipid transport system substrate-binding protein